MTVLLPAAERAVPELVASTTRLLHPVAQPDQSGLHRNDGRRELERRRRRIHALQRLVVERFPRILEQRLVFASEEIPPMKSLGSKTGALWRARTAPVFGSIATAPPCMVESKRVAVNRWRSRSMLVRNSGPDSGSRSGRAPACLTTRPLASTSTKRDPSMPWITASYCFSRPAFPICWPGRYPSYALARQFRFVDLARVADDRRHCLAVRVTPLGRRLDHEAREPAAFLLEDRHLLEARVAQDHRRTRPAPRGTA